MKTIALLFGSNIFMTFAWYGHLKNFRESPLWIAVLFSWGVAFFEYCLQVPANRIGYQEFSLGQLKVIQEVMTMAVFMGFSAWYMKKPITMDLLYASACLGAAAWFMFRNT